MQRYEPRAMRLAEVEGEWHADKFELAPAQTPPDAPPPSPLDVQVGGDHYKGMAIQPVEYITKNNIGFVEGNVIKYVSRWRNKNGVQDLEKARHILDILIQIEKATK